MSLVAIAHLLDETHENYSTLKFYVLNLSKPKHHHEQKFCFKMSLNMSEIFSILPSLLKPFAVVCNKHDSRPLRFLLQIDPVFLKFLPSCQSGRFVVFKIQCDNVNTIIHFLRQFYN